MGRKDRLAGQLDRLCREAIRQDATPSVALAVGSSDQIFYQRVFGWRRLVPTRQKALLGTIYDLASLTKPLATGLLFCCLLELKLVDLDDPVRRFLPIWRRGRKKHITLRHLLTHTSGLPAFKNYLEVSDLSLSAPQRGTFVRDDILRTPLEAAPGKKFIYSDLGFILLGEIATLITGESLDHLVEKFLYKKLGLRETRFCPPQSRWQRCAATTYRDGALLQGQVHDPNAFYLGGVSGHAGLFSDLSGLVRLCQMILREGEGNGQPVIGPDAIRLFRSNISPCQDVQRGIGVDIDSPYSLQMRGRRFPIGVFGHTGYTGTSFLIDPRSDLFVILLTNRVHPDDKRDISQFRIAVMDTIAGALFDR
ncbi:MAG: serine hydrolase [Armatimonadetes bacterium]|nr:serine hydrolase [Armatimonadota bacterium]MDW8122204.1 serine hydrolase [Armatimonadota bacterium]